MTKQRLSSLPSSVSRLQLSEPEHSPKASPQTHQEPAFAPEAYTQPFIDFISKNPTIFHAVDHFSQQLEAHGYTRLSERDAWTSQLKRGGKYFLTRNDSSLIAFAVGTQYESGNGIGLIGGHIDSLSTKLKPVPTLPNKAGYQQLAVAPYAGALNKTWWDRDLGIGGRVLVKDANGVVKKKLVKLDWPIARIPTLAPHFGAASTAANPETNMVPIIGIDNSDIFSENSSFTKETVNPIKPGTFAATQPPKLVKIIAKELGVTDYSNIVNWELELFDSQPAQIGGLEKDLIFAGRIDDKVCCYAAQEALLASPETTSPGLVKLVGMFDDEEVGSLLRQGARSSYLSGVIDRIAEAFANGNYGPNVYNQTIANSFLISSDVTHAVNPNYLNAYLENHQPRLNVGVTISLDPNGHVATDAVSHAILQQIADRSDSKLQLFQIRNDSRSGGTIGPMTSAQLGVRTADAGIPQLSMHSIRATIGHLDPGLGVKLFKGFFDHFEEVDKSFRSL